MNKVSKVRKFCFYSRRQVSIKNENIKREVSSREQEFAPPSLVLLVNIVKRG